MFNVCNSSFNLLICFSFSCVVFLWAWRCEYKEKVAEILKNMYKHTRKIRGNFFAKHFGFLSIFRGLFNKQAIIIRVFQYFFTLFFLVSCDMFCIICVRSSGVGFFRLVLPGACVGDCLSV